MEGHSPFGRIAAERQGGKRVKFVIQRVTKASCRVEGEITGQIERGFVVLIGVEDSDNIRIADKMIQKLLNMRIFADEQGKTNLALADVKGELLLISQFTLCANCKKGNRPSFTGAGKPEEETGKGVDLCG